MSQTLRTHPKARLHLSSFWKLRLLLLYFCLAMRSPAWAQGDPRVMIQGFIWEANSDGVKEAAKWGVHGLPSWTGKWYAHIEQEVGALSKAHFDLIWLPPPSQGNATGYYPTRYFELTSSYGSNAEQLHLLTALRQQGIEPVADVVVNHRNGSEHWFDLKNPDWPTTAICSNDDFWTRSDGDLKDKIDRDVRDSHKSGHADTGEGNGGARDIDHKQPLVRADIKKYLDILKVAGYRGWRFDQVKGYSPEYVAEYNQASKPSFSVGEYLDGRGPIDNWLNGVAGTSLAFDFPTQGELKAALAGKNYGSLRQLTDHNSSPGILGARPGDSVTFLENHDSGFPQHQSDTFFRNDPILMQGYAFILTHPGIPCVYWKHFVDWQLAQPIGELISARKYAGINSQSFVSTRLEQGSYIAEVGDKKTPSSTLIVKIGPAMWQPDLTKFALETSGEDYAVWVRRSMKAVTQAKVDAPAKPVP